MKGFTGDIEALTLGNDLFRRVLYTGRHLQLVMMTLPPGGEIGAETHTDRDQFFRIEAGKAAIDIDGVTHRLGGEGVAVVPAGARHNVRNVGTGPLRLYTLYGPPEHVDGAIHATREEAEGAHEHFDGHTTE